MSKLIAVLILGLSAIGCDAQQAVLQLDAQVASMHDGQTTQHDAGTIGHDQTLKSTSEPANITLKPSPPGPFGGDVCYWTISDKPIHEIRLESGPTLAYGKSKPWTANDPDAWMLCPSCDRLAPSEQYHYRVSALTDDGNIQSFSQDLEISCSYETNWMTNFQIGQIVLPDRKYPIKWSAPVEIGEGWIYSGSTNPPPLAGPQFTDNGSPLWIYCGEKHGDFYLQLLAKAKDTDQYFASPVGQYSCP